MELFFDKHKALIITLLFMGVFILGLHTIVLSKTTKIPDELLLELAVAQLLAEKEPEKAVAPMPEPTPVSRANKSHRAFNKEARMDETEFNQRFQELSEKLNKGSKSVSEDADAEQGTAIIAAKNTNKKNKNEKGKGDDKKPPTIKETNVHGSSISYSVLSRKALELPNPVYTCSRRGKIVVNIVVNQYGHVENATINTASSNSTNGCLYDSALQYANRSQFNTSTRLRQLGTITYLFNY